MDSDSPTLQAAAALSMMEAQVAESKRKRGRVDCPRCGREVNLVKGEPKRHRRRSSGFQNNPVCEEKKDE